MGEGRGGGDIAFPRERAPGRVRDGGSAAKTGGDKVAFGRVRPAGLRLGVADLGEVALQAIEQRSFRAALEQLADEGVSYKTGQFPMRALGRSRASMDLDGFVKVIADQTTDEILGVHMIGARCADLIAEAVVAMEFRASAEDVSRMSHAHPTFTEAIKEAALAATDDRALHV